MVCEGIPFDINAAAFILKSIGNCAFFGCRNLLKINIPDDVEIGFRAFAGSVAKKDIIFDDPETIKEKYSFD